MIWTSKFKKLMSPQKLQSKTAFSKTHRINCPNAKTERILRSKEKKKILSRKGTPLRNSEDLSKETLQTTTEGLMTYSTLTQGGAPPREGQERAWEKELPKESQQLLGGERTIPGPQHDRKHHRDWGRDLGIYTRGAAHQLIIINRGTSCSLEERMLKLKLQ